MSHPITKKVKQLGNFGKVIGELSEKLEAVKTELAEIQADTSTDPAKLARRHINLQGEHDELQFQLEANIKRRKILGREIQEDCDNEKVDVRKAQQEYKYLTRRQLVAEITSTPEFQEFIEQVKGFYWLGNYFDFDTCLLEVLGVSPDWRDSREIAERIFDIPPEPELSPEVEEAMQAIDELDSPESDIAVTYRHIKK